MDIRRLGGITLYYPYLDQKNGFLVPLHTELSWLYLYSLFVDRILIPPRSLFLGQYGNQNLADLMSIPSLRYLIESGALITTTTDKNIRDLSDLFENYSGQTIQSLFCLKDFSIYTRDVSFQKKIASEYIIESISKKEHLSQQDKDFIIAATKENLNHNIFVSKVLSALKGEVWNIKNDVLKIFAEGYFYAGARGNSAILPPVIKEQPPEYFDYFYSKSIINYFAAEFQNRLKRPLVLIKPDELLRARSNLAIFRVQYFNIASKYREHFHLVASLLTKSHPALRLRAPILGIQAAVSTSIGLALSPVFGMAAFGIAATSKYTFDVISRGFRINEKVLNTVRNSLIKCGIIEPYAKDLLELLESFDNIAKHPFDS